MPSFSRHSEARLLTCHPDLQRVIRHAMETATADLDFAVLCGHRGKVDQDAAVAAGLSKTPYPTSKHNAEPSMAVDIAPYPVDWNDHGRFKHLAEHVLASAAEIGVSIRWGGTWTTSASDNLAKFCDMPHFELIEAKNA